MTAPDLIPTLRRVADEARAIEAEAKRPHCMTAPGAERVLEELTGARPTTQWRLAAGPEVTTAACLAKSVRILASMLAAREGAVIVIAGLLDDMAARPLDDPRDARARRRCLSCGRAFTSWSAANRLCNRCAPLVARDEPYVPGD